MKVVINKCYGGFGLSHEAMMLYAEKKGITVYPKKDRGLLLYFTTPEQNYENWLYDRDIDREDPVLVEVVEQLGEGANGRCASLEIVVVPEGTAYEISEYDGYERVEAPRSFYG